MTSLPRTRYAKRPEGHVAYQVVGDGPFDLLFIPDWSNNVELMWEDPGLARFLRRLASFSRLIVYDKLGIGVSDRRSGVGHPLDWWTDDVLAVMKAAGSKQCALFGHSEGGMMAMLLAATFPEKFPSLVLADAAARRIRAPDYPWGFPPDSFDTIKKVFSDAYMDGGWLEHLAPDRANDRAFRDWYARFVRLTFGPGDAMEGWSEVLTHSDLRPVLPTIRQPTLVLHRKDNQYIRVENGRFLAEHIPNARFVEIPGNEHLYFVGETDRMVDEIQEFLTGTKPGVEVDRVLSTILFTDIVGSTEKAAELGDRAWKELLEGYYQVARRETARYRGREVDTAGDGYFASFDGPARAVRSACEIRDALSGLGISVRAGVHTGECELIGDKVGGIAVHIGSRVASEAGANEVLVSSTVKDLVAGSGIRFEPRGARVLKGVPGEWQVFAVT